MVKEEPLTVDIDSAGDEDGDSNPEEQGLSENNFSILSNSSRGKRRRYKGKKRPSLSGRTWTKIQDKNAPRRPRSAYVLFLSAARAKYGSSKQAHQSQSQINTSLAAEWQTLTEEERQVYTERSIKEKDEYMMLMADYRKTKEHREFEEKKAQIMNYRRNCRKKGIISDQDVKVEENILGYKPRGSESKSLKKVKSEDMGRLNSSSLPSPTRRALSKMPPGTTLADALYAINDIRSARRSTVSHKPVEYSLLTESSSSRLESSSAVDSPSLQASSSSSPLKAAQQLIQAENKKPAVISGKVTFASQAPAHQKPSKEEQEMRRILAGKPSTIGLDIAVFSDRFLQYNREREHQLRLTRTAIGKEEEEAAAIKRITGQIEANCEVLKDVNKKQCEEERSHLNQLSLLCTQTAKLLSNIPEISQDPVKLEFFLISMAESKESALSKKIREALQSAEFN